MALLIIAMAGKSVSVSIVAARYAKMPLKSTNSIAK